MTTIRTASSDVTPIPSERPPKMRRAKKISLIIGAIILFLMILLEFNPLHPIWWWHEQIRQFHAGEHAGDLAKARRHRAEELAAQARLHQSAATPSPATIPVPAPTH